MTVPRLDLVCRVFVCTTLPMYGYYTILYGIVQVVCGCRRDPTDRRTCIVPYYGTYYVQ